jgi:hypothetical protein
MKLCFYQCCGSGPNSDPDPPACTAWMLKPFLKRQNCPSSGANHQISVLLRKISVLTEVRGLALKFGQGGFFFKKGPFNLGSYNFFEL